MSVDEGFLYFVNKIFFVYFVDKMVLTSHKITCKNMIFQDNVNFDTYTMRDHLIKCKLIQNSKLTVLFLLIINSFVSHC
jgi:uncharacterized protein YwqG